MENLQIQINKSDVVVCVCVCVLPVSSEEDEESDGAASNQSAEDGSVNENMNIYSNNGSTGMCII